MKKLFFILMLSFVSISTFANELVSSIWGTCTAHYVVRFVDQNGDYLYSQSYTATADNCAEAMRRAQNGYEVFF
jgi:hypothetical protein